MAGGGSPMHWLAFVREGRWGMVALQGFMFLLVAVTALLPAPGGEWAASLWLSLVPVLVGAAGVLSTGRSLDGSLTPSPVPNGEGMVAAGLYRWVRHPMYTALDVICLGVAVGSGKWTCYLAVAALCVFFEVKTRAEERYLRDAYPGYAEYAARTGKFLPGIGRARA
ncbi:isoprenylcysteine carboxylmethyltransferase family protein [Demequina sp. NBRC 110057]|uniref:methyltransferase family protein n=1 Tax=Demequina sp. NBRC 110057 TaxID=1570346 RepID=UPI000A056604|nr:isoprenylcysteine carboxylmethyltransferase family protein [Demequina sp. NBRC 110057]